MNLFQIVSWKGKIAFACANFLHLGLLVVDHLDFIGWILKHDHQQINSPARINIGKSKRLNVFDELNIVNDFEAWIGWSFVELQNRIPIRFG